MDWRRRFQPRAHPMHANPLRRRTLVAATLLVGLLPFAPASATAFDPLDPATCGYPLGPAAENGRFAVLSGGADPEYAMIDASFAHATKTQLTVVSLWGSLHAVYDGRWRIGDGGSRHNIQVKTWGEAGWNVTTEYPSNPDVTNSTPIGNAINPRAAAFNDMLWVVFARESSHNFQTNGSLIMLRGRAADGTWGPDIQVTPAAWSSINQQPNILPVGDKLLVAWVSTEGALSGLDMSLKGRLFDGTAFGPVSNISRPNDGFGEGAFSLATDGHRMAAAWISFNVSSVVTSYVPKFAAFDGTSWLPEVDLWVENHSLSSRAAVEFYHGQLYLVFDTNDPALSIHGDFDVFLRTADPATLALSGIHPLVDSSNRGDDFDAEMDVFDDRLFLTWVSSDDVLTLGSDLDLVVTSFDGSLWTPPEDVTWDEKWPDDAQRAEFVEHEGALHLNWIALVKPPGSTAKDQRVATLLLERGARWYDGLEATFEYVSPPKDGENATAVVSVTNASGAEVTSSWLSVRFPDGSWQRLGAEGPHLVNFTYNASLIAPFGVLACGKPVGLTDAPQPPPVAPPVPGFEALLLIGAAAVAAVAAAHAARRDGRKSD